MKQLGTIIVFLLIVYFLFNAVGSLFKSTTPDYSEEPANQQISVPQQTNIYAVPENIQGDTHRKVDCAVCECAGKVKCISCDGQGYIMLSSDKMLYCGTCNTTGKMDCGACSGKGYKAELIFN